MLRHIVGNVLDHAFCIRFRMLHKHPHRSYRSVSHKNCSWTSLAQRRRKYQHTPDPIVYILSSSRYCLLLNRMCNNGYMPPCSADTHRCNVETVRETFVTFHLPFQLVEIHEVLCSSVVFLFRNSMIRNCSGYHIISTKKTHIFQIQFKEILFWG